MKISSLIMLFFFINFSINHLKINCNCNLIKEIIQNKSFLEINHLENDSIIYIEENRFCTLNEKASKKINIQTLSKENKNKKALQIIAVKNDSTVIFFNKLENMEIKAIKTNNEIKLSFIEK